MKFSCKLTLLLAATAIFISAEAFGQSAKVLKVTRKGDRAVIKLPQGLRLKKGQIITISDQDEAVSTPSMSVGSAATRNYAVTGSFSYESNSGESKTGNNNPVDIKNTEIVFAVGLRKNLKFIEVSVDFNFNDDSSSEVSTTTFGLGASGEYNLYKNIPGLKWTPHVGAEIGYLSGTTEYSTKREETLSGLYYGAFAGAKYFPWPNKGLALRADLFYQQSSTDTEDTPPGTPTTSGEKTESSVGIRAGISYYF